MVLILSAAGADGDVVDASRHQRLKHTLGTEPGHIEGVKGSLLISQSDQVTVHVSLSCSPGHAQEVHVAVIADRHVSHCGWN